MTQNIQISAVSRIFSSAVFKEMAVGGKSRLFARLLSEAQITDEASKLNYVGEVFDMAFRVLKTGYFRDEYVYKAALAQKILLGRHSLHTACMLNEFRVGKCRADIAILNGTATVYEIKSERDSLARIEKQLEHYKKFFAKVYVIAGEDYVEELVGCTSTDVGILKLSNRFQITTIREAQECVERIDPVVIFESIRRAEAEKILSLLGKSMPVVPNTLIHGEMRKCFERLDPQDVHSAMVTTLKHTRSLQTLKSLVANLPTSLHAAALSVRVKPMEHKALVKAVQTPVREAINWA